MRTTLDIEESILTEAIHVTGASSKKRAVEIALHEYVRMKRRQELIHRIGTYVDFDLTLEELGKLRDDA
jgi:Arc/MetJ family transcription regulator